MARRSIVYRCNLFGYGSVGPQTEGVTSRWTINLELIIRQRTIFAGEVVELYVTIQANLYPLNENARIRFDILESDYFLTGELDDRIVSFLGTGVTQIEEGFTPHSKSTVFHRLTDGQSIRSYIEQYTQNQSDYQDHILVIEEPPHEGSLYHIIAWWAALGLEDTSRTNPEFYFIINVNDVFEDKSEGIIHVSRSVNIPMTLSLDAGNRTFTLITRFRGTDIHLDFRGEIIISRTYGPDYNRYSQLNRFSLDSMQDQDGFTVSRTTEGAIEIQKILQVSDIDRDEPEGYITSHPFLLPRQHESITEHMRLNRTNEPGYAFKVQLSRGDERFGAEKVNMVIRAFENIFMEADRLPELSGHPAEDDEFARNYRQRMVGIPDVIVEELQNQILAANNEVSSNTNFLWWRPSRGSAGSINWFTMLPVRRRIKNRQQVEQKMNEFAGLATSNEDISFFINHHFDFEEINSDLRAIQGTGMVGEYLYFFSSNNRDCEITLRIVGHSGDQRVEDPIVEDIILEGITRVRTRHQYLNIESIEIEQGTLEGILKGGVEDSEAFSINITERKIRYGNLQEFNDFLRDGGCRLSVRSTDDSDISRTIIVPKAIIILGYRDENLRDQVAEEIQIGTTGNINFYKIHHIYFNDNFNGIISIRATRDSTHKTLWRNIFDEDIPEEILTLHQSRGVNQINILTEGRAQYLQKLANIFREYLGIDKNIWVFLYYSSVVQYLNESAGTIKAAETTDSRYYQLIQYYFSRHNNRDFFTDFPNVLRRLFHECKHIHQDDRVAKLPPEERNVEFGAWQSGHDTWDMRQVKAWKLNKGFGNISPSRSLENYEAQITEVDVREFAQRVITEEWFRQLDWEETIGEER